MDNAILPNERFEDVVVMQRNPHIVYVQVNDFGYITTVDSSAFLTETAGWIEIDSGYGDRYALAQGNYFPKPIWTDGGAYRYKLVDGKPVECTAEEIAQQEELQKPSRPSGATLEERVATVESDVASLTTAIKKGLSL